MKLESEKSLQTIDLKIFKKNYLYFSLSKGFYGSDDLTSVYGTTPKLQAS